MRGVVRAREPMARHTTYRIGGPAALSVECDTVADLACATAVLCRGGRRVDGARQGQQRARGRRRLRRCGSRPGQGVQAARDRGRAAAHRRGVDSRAPGAGRVPAGLSGPGVRGRHPRDRRRRARDERRAARDEWIGSIVESVTLFVPGEGLVGAARPGDRVGVPQERASRAGYHRRSASCGSTEADAVQHSPLDGGEPPPAQSAPAARTCRAPEACS